MGEYYAKVTQEEVEFSRRRRSWRPPFWCWWCRRCRDGWLVVVTAFP
ncbi:MAG: hypothetical protein ACLSVD_02350 [Eggerthellaceae bacterium]